MALHRQQGCWQAQQNRLSQAQRPHCEPVVHGGTQARAQAHPGALPEGGASRSAEDWDAFKDARREYTKNVQKAARDCYRKFATDLHDLKAMAVFNKMTQAVPRHDVGVMRRDSGEFTTSTEESLEVVMASAFPESEPVLPSERNPVTE